MFLSLLIIHYLQKTEATEAVAEEEEEEEAVKNGSYGCSSELHDLSLPFL